MKPAYLGLFHELNGELQVTPTRVKDDIGDRCTDVWKLDTRKETLQ